MLFATWFDDCCFQGMIGMGLLFTCICVLGHRANMYAAKNPEVGTAVKGAATGVVVRLLGRLFK